MIFENIRKDDLELYRMMEIDTGGKVRLDEESVRFDINDGYSFELIVEDGFDYAAYVDSLRRKGI